MAVREASFFLFFYKNDCCQQVCTVLVTVYRLISIFSSRTNMCMSTVVWGVSSRGRREWVSTRNRGGTGGAVVGSERDGWNFRDGVKDV